MPKILNVEELSFYVLLIGNISDICERY